MEELIQGFIDEALQLIESLDGLLMDLDENPDNEGSIQEIFRVMHTIKGSSGMFGFSNTEKLTHHLEDIYDLIREKKLTSSEHIVSLTLKASDVLKDLLQSRDKVDDEGQKNFNDILEQVKLVLPNNESEEIVLTETQTAENKSSNSEKYFYIAFMPNEDVLKRGLAVPNLFEELHEVGEVAGLPYMDNIPEPEEFDPTNFYLSWDLFVKTTNPADDVEDCFMFYMDHEYIIIELNPTDLNGNKKFLETCININKGKSTVADLQLVLNRLVESHKSEVVQEIEKPKEKEIKKSTKNANTIKVDADKLDELVNLVSELVTLNSRLELFTDQFENDAFKKTVKSVSKLSKRFRDNALELRLIPVKVLELKMQRLIRDLSKTLHKQVEFIVEGTKTELDKNIIARLEGPLMHILRNSLDHGLETEEERINAGKPEKGVIRFIAFYSGSNVFIQVQDDGRGIDPEKIKNKAIEKGLINAEDSIEKHEIFNLLFHPGFSTADAITNISGRGVGLDAVKSEILNMRGEIDIESEIGLGTSFTLKLPLTLSIIDTLMTQVNHSKLLIPREYIVHTDLFTQNSITTDKYEYNGVLIPLISLQKELNNAKTVSGKEHVIIVNQHDKHYALTVDKIFGEHQAVVKPLGYYNTDHIYFSSASILGDGSLALILDVAKIINSKRSKSNLGNYNLK